MMSASCYQIQKKIKGGKKTDKYSKMLSFGNLSEVCVDILCIDPVSLDVAYLNYYGIFFKTKIPTLEHYC